MSVEESRACGAIIVDVVVHLLLHRLSFTYQFKR